MSLTCRLCVFRATRALKGLNLGPKSKVTFKDFKKMNDQYPALFLPAFLFQHSIRTKVSLLLSF